MKKTCLAVLGAMSVLANLAPASAATIYKPGSANFSLTDYKGSFSLAPSTSGKAIFEFTLPSAGTLLTGSLIGSGTSLTAKNWVNITSIIFDGTAVAYDKAKVGALEVGAADLTGLKTLKGINDLVITYTTKSHGTGTFSGSFTAAVPEPSAWALMLVGVGVAGAAMRRKQRNISRDAIAG